MILKGSQRGGARQLARHLLRTDENDHVEVVSLRGFMSGNLLGALSEAEAVAGGTRCKQFLFSLSFNPPKDSGATLDDLMDAVERAEQVLGLNGQPRAVVLHEKCNRLHAHAVWSRIDPVRLKALPMSFFKTKLAGLSKDLFLDHGWDLPDGHRQNGWKSPDSFSLAEWQQAKRIDLDPRELKALFREAWAASNTINGFRHLLATRGYFLAHGDRRGFVAVDVHGEVFSVARMVGIKTRAVAAKLGAPDSLPTVAEVKASLTHRLGENFREVMQEARRCDRLELAPLRADHRIRVKHQRRARTSQLRDRVAPACKIRSIAPQPHTGGSRTSSSTPQRPTTCRASKPLRVLPTRDRRAAERGEPAIFIRPQRPGESFDEYLAYRRSCFQLIESQQEERRATLRRIEDSLAAQRARRMQLIARIAHLVDAKPAS